LDKGEEGSEWPTILILKPESADTEAGPTNYLSCCECSVFTLESDKNKATRKELKDSNKSIRKFGPGLVGSLSLSTHNTSQFIFKAQANQGDYMRSLKC